MARSAQVPQFSSWKKRVVFWLSVGIFNSLKVFTLLPLTWQVALGRRLGRLLRKKSPKMRRVTETNIALCFPELTTAEREQLIHQNFESLGIGAFENLFAAWGSPKKLRHLLNSVNGLEQIEQTLASGTGVIILFPHLIPMYLIGHIMMLNSGLPFSLMYHSPKNAAMNYFIYSKLAPHADKVFNRNNIREMINHLRSGNIVWYAPDLDLGRKRSEFIPFFGTPAATLTAPVRIAEITGAKLFPIAFYRTPGKLGYDVTIHPPLTDFPSGEIKQDLTQINQVVETIVRQRPAEYLWQYKRFNTRPAGEEKLYRS